VRLLGLSLILMVASLGVSACGSDDDDEDPLAVQAIVESCSPYNSMDGDRHLEVKVRLIGIAKRHLAFANYVKITDDPTKTSVEAHYTTNDADKTMTVKLKGEDVTYRLAALTDNSCALLSGDTKKADLNASWFGEKDDD
jgi:hypothetical protein